MKVENALFFSFFGTLRKEVCIEATYAKMQDLRKNVLAWPAPHINEIVLSRESENYA